MNELRKISIAWGIMLVIVFSTLTFFGLKWKNRMKPYFELEDKIVEVTKNYVDL